MKPVLVGAYLP